MKQCWGGANKTFLNETGLYNDTYGLSDPSFFRDTVLNVSDDCFRITDNYKKESVNVDIQKSLSIYAALVLSVFLLSLVRTTSFFQMCMKASITLHNKMFRSVLRSPVAFFDNNPVGK